MQKYAKNMQKYENNLQKICKKYAKRGPGPVQVTAHYIITENDWFIIVTICQLSSAVMSPFDFLLLYAVSSIVKVDIFKTKKIAERRRGGVVTTILFVLIV